MTWATFSDGWVQIGLNSNIFIIIHPRRYLSKQYILNYNSFWLLWPRIRPKDFLCVNTNIAKLKCVYNNSAKKIFIQTIYSKI